MSQHVICKTIDYHYHLCVGVFHVHVCVCGGIKLRFWVGPSWSSSIVRVCFSARGPAVQQSSACVCAVCGFWDVLREVTYPELSEAGFPSRPPVLTHT